MEQSRQADLPGGPGGQATGWARIAVGPLARSSVSGAAGRGSHARVPAGGRRERRAACGLSHGSPARAARPRRPPAAAARGREQCQAPLAAARVPKNRRSALLSCILISLSGSRHNLAHELTTSDYAISTLTAADSRGAARHSLDMAWGSPPRPRTPHTRLLHATPPGPPSDAARGAPGSRAARRGAR